MPIIDYTGNDYHAKRHPEIFGNRKLIDTWSSYSHHVYLDSVSQNSNILEVGCGLGINLASVNKFANVYGVEPSAAAREHCATLGLKTFESLKDLDDLNIEFDYILLRHVLEHVPEPHNFLVELKKYLAKNGKLVIVLPIESPYSPINKDDIDHHLYNWSRQTIYNLLLDIGYNTTKAEINWYNGRRLFITVFNIFGINAYIFCINFLGRISRSSEIIINAFVPE